MVVGQEQGLACSPEWNTGVGTWSGCGVKWWLIFAQKVCGLGTIFNLGTFLAFGFWFWFGYLFLPVVTCFASFVPRVLPVASASYRVSYWNSVLRYTPDKKTGTVSTPPIINCSVPQFTSHYKCCFSSFPSSASKFILQNNYYDY